MKRVSLLFLMLLIPALACFSRKVTIKADNQPAAAVFRAIVEQTGKNFVYSSDLLSGLRVSVDAKNRPLKKVLDDIFKGSSIEYRIKGDNVILKRKKRKRQPTVFPGQSRNLRTPFKIPEIDAPVMLDEVIVESRLEDPAVGTVEIGARKISAEDVRNIPTLFGESDVLKAIQTEPGVTGASEALAGMQVHGGNADENLCMLDNVPLYQVNHLGGLFSAFNTDIVRYIDFFKSSIPAKYDGRLSSFMDVRLQNGSRRGHHGTARLGITSGAFSISGPIGKRTGYMAAIRRSWLEILSVPLLALANAGTDDKTRFRYYFMDLNAKVSHRFSPDVNGFISAYFGNDYLNSGGKDKSYYGFETTATEDEKYRLMWGNLVVQAGLNYRISPNISSEFTAAFTRYFSSLRSEESTVWAVGDTSEYVRSKERTDNHINDWIFRADFDWSPRGSSRIRFGANYTRHLFLPSRTKSEHDFNSSAAVRIDSVWSYGANEFNAYIEDDWKISDKFRINAGIHGSLFNIDGKTRGAASPRLSAAYFPTGNYAVKASYSRTVQYVHQLAQSYLALPSDRWIPITGNFKPETADKVAVGGYWRSDNGEYAVSIEAYYKSMHNLIEFCDEYYLYHPLDTWNARLTSGKGSAKGIDVNIQKSFGNITGQLSYSLAWADRQFRDKNGGRRYPARNDNRHKINLTVNWKISHKVSLNASWTGHSGNRYTLLAQSFEGPSFSNSSFYPSDMPDDIPMRGELNNYRLPFYHRLDLACTVRNSRGFWEFGLYNAYCHLNTVAVKRSYTEVHRTLPDGSTQSAPVPCFEKVRLFPIIPSISYTWQF